MSAVRIGVGVEAACDQYAERALSEAGLTDFVEYGIHVARGVPEWVKAVRERLGAGFNLHPLDLNLGGGDSSTDGWCEALAGLARELRATALVSDMGFWYLGHRGSTWPRPPSMPMAALACRDTAAHIARVCGIPFRVENPPLEWVPGQPSLWHFLERASDDEHVELCLDLSHLLQFEMNVHGREPTLPRSFPWQKVTELHLAGFIRLEYQGRLHYIDEHLADIPDEEYRLLSQVLELRGSGTPLEICLEMEPRGAAAFEAEARRLKETLGGSAR
ncbi:hypothetical protein D187_001254 [Cystobacter fuscus DSM 2262]|uniref:Xylose isomerase-like TIM barrel domain-containing protein n=1 Tax=Cystobacter fuscus (strain ATCC 25194 / DSM 2262 / NBRC 100088 / M29) TaxID=1242864 RepID=S9PEJ0_CYSF2|nr:DUF692 family multinuclear iron-containing protein [Cystobacter fuscus]EPX61471.1 hypothetical protein D187_001254 [Cystobacter fuscus DSM 2262]